jgi:hypothetical protein
VVTMASLAGAYQDSLRQKTAVHLAYVPVSCLAAGGLVMHGKEKVYGSIP